MPETRMSEIVKELDEREFNVKLAAIETAYAADEKRQVYFEKAVELLKTAEEAKEVEPMTDSQLVSVAAQMVEEQMAKEAGEAAPAAEAAEATEAAELTEEEAKQLYEAGQTCGEALKIAGMTAEDLDKVGSDEEFEALGRLAAQVVRASEEKE
jgi:hypothetical protein